MLEQWKAARLEFICLVSVTLQDVPFFLLTVANFIIYQWS